MGLHGISVSTSSSITQQRKLDVPKLLFGSGNPSHTHALHKVLMYRDVYGKVLWFRWCVWSSWLSCLVPYTN